MQQKSQRDWGKPSRLRDKLLLFNGRTSFSQQDLAKFIGVSTAALRNWEAGYSKPTAQNLRRLIEIYLAQSIFPEGEEYTEAADLWQSAQERGLKAPFDEQWFQALLVNQDANKQEENKHKPILQIEPIETLEQEHQQESNNRVQDDGVSHEQVPHQQPDSEMQDDSVSVANIDTQLLQAHTIPPSPAAPLLSRRIMIIGLSSLVAGGVVGSALAWEVIHTQARTLPTAKWISSGAMAMPHSFFRATSLKNGLVLIEGGITPDKSSTAQSELFDPITGTWRKTKGMLNQQRAKHTATLLPNGNVLVAGGIGAFVTSSAELYNPATETWALTKQAMLYSRARHTATLLQSGKVFVVGGVGNYTTEIYDSANGTWSLSGNMLTPRSNHIAIRLLDGKVLVAGGTTTNDSRSVTATAELYNPQTNTWTSLQNMHIARADCTAVLLPNGKVLVIGGHIQNNNATPTTEIYDPNLNSWQLGASMKYPRQTPLGQEAVIFEDGNILVIGGDVQGTSELYSPTTHSWTTSLPLRSPHYLGATVLLMNGQVLIAGGFDVPASNDKRRITAYAERYVLE